MSDYDNTHRALLQVFLSRGTLTYETTKPILANILTASDPSRETMPNDITPSDFNAYISALNSAISPFDLEIRSSLPQNPYPDSDTQPERVYALVNTTSDPITQLATMHSADEIAFLKRVLDQMFEGNSRKREVYAITRDQGVQLARGSGTQVEGQSTSALTLKQAEQVLDALVEEGWLEKSKKGFCRLSPRALMELRIWLVEAYNEAAAEGSEDEEQERVERVRFCHGCREIVIVGQRCVDWDCGVRVHDFCARNMFRMAGGQKCPACKKEWTGEVPVGEKAARNYTRPSGVSAGRRSSGTVRNGAGSDGE
ncbi:Nse1 non-SMC component of SMC5-6 complex-like protein [Elsinoe fawcettii]|nr:Nse1 non-SMC component of SMC5-6 complex-like protein [Elsinoe fawcettii]